MVGSLGNYCSEGFMQSMVQLDGFHKNVSFPFYPFVFSCTRSSANEPHNGFQLSQQLFFIKEILTRDSQEESLLAPRHTFDYSISSLSVCSQACILGSPATEDFTGIQRAWLTCSEELEVGKHNSSP